MFNDLQIRFRRDKHGQYDLSSDLIACRTFKESYKYANEARFCLGVVKVQLLDGKILGRRSILFDYTAKQIVSLTEWRIKVTAKIQ